MTCDSRIFDPVQYQTVFCGLSIQSFSCSIGYNDQISQLTVKAFQDPCAATGTNYKVTYDLETKAALGLTQDLSQQLFQNADPGFTQPDIGSPHYFRVGDDFEFQGILVNYTEQKDSSQNPGYSLTLNDPREILQGCQVILGGYVGSVYTTPNVFNLYGFSESLGTACSDALLSDGTGPGRFGGSGRNDAGISWNRIKRSLSAMTAHLPALVNNYGLGRIKLGNYEYMLDWSEIPEIVGYRFTATSLTIADIINEITTFLGMDWFCQLLHLYTEGGELVRIIKIRTISRRIQPDLNQVSNFIGDGTGVIASSKGRELRNEVCSSVLVGGPKQELYIQTSNHEDIYVTEQWKNMTISPFWGFKPDGGVVIGRGLNMDHNFDIDITAANITDVTNSATLTWYNISVAELHACLAGKDVWKTYIALHKASLMRQLGLDEAPLSFMDAFTATLEDNLNNVPGDIEPIAIHNAKLWNLFGFYLDQLANGVNRDNFIGGYDLISMRKHFTEAFDRWFNNTANFQRIQFNLDTLFQIVENYATNYYGQQFMVRLTDYDPYFARLDTLFEQSGTEANYNSSFICVKYDSEADRLVYSRDVSDGGWTDYESGFMGIQNEIYLDRFRLHDNRIGAFVRFNAAQNLKFPEINSEDFVYQDLSYLSQDSNPLNDLANRQNLEQTLYTKCNINVNYVFTSNGNGVFDYTDPRVVISLPSIIKFHNENLDTIPYFLQFLFREGQAIQDPNNPNAREYTNDQLVTAFRSVMSNIGGSALHAGEDFLRAAPNAICIPFKSNIETYGPWFAVGANGKANYTQSDDLVPWNYGSTIGMHNSASLLATSELTNMLQGETGFIEVPGLPALNLGDELQSGGSSITVTRNILLNRGELEGQEFTTGELETTPNNGLYGPNISNIDVSLSVTDGAKTRYSLRTFTPSFGNTNRYLSERLKNRSIRAQQRRRERRENFAQQDLRRLVTDIINQRIRDKQNDTGLFPKTPHLVLVGQTMTYPKEKGSNDRFARSFVHTQNLMESKSELANWENKHFMSWDGLLRPIHTSGFYAYKEGTTGENENLLKASAPAIPPVNEQNSSNDRITAYTLNPFLTNNVGVNDLDRQEYPFGNNACGHDIEYLARGSELPDDLAIQHNDDYASAYDAENNVVDYRAMALKAPLILTGYGRDINGKPVPNAEGPDGPSNKYLENWLKRSDTWKTGPLDVRWDEARGVWTCFPGYSLVRARISETVSEEWGQTGIARLIGLPESFKPVDEDGVLIPPEDEDSGPQITFMNTVGYPLRKGMKVVCYYSVEEGKYWVLQAPDPIYAVYIPDNIIPSNSTSIYYSGRGFLYDNTVMNFNDHIESETGSINVITLGMPIRGGSEAICYERKLNQFHLIKNQARPLCVAIDAVCEQSYTSSGNLEGLVVTDTTIWLESNWLKPNDGTDDIGGCKLNPAPIDFVGYSSGGV